MDRKTNGTVSAIVRIHQMKPGLAVTQENVNGSSHKSAQYLVLVLCDWQEYCYLNYLLNTGC